MFQSFRSTFSGWVRGERADRYHVLEDPTTGAPVGLQSPRGNGPQGLWAPTDLTAAQIAAPTADMLADLNAEFRLNVAPYTRYKSNGTALIPMLGLGLAGLPTDPSGLAVGQPYLDGTFVCVKLS